MATPSCAFSGVRVKSSTLLYSFVVSDILWLFCLLSSRAFFSFYWRGEGNWPRDFDFNLIEEFGRAIELVNKGIFVRTTREVNVFFWFVRDVR